MPASSKERIAVVGLGYVGLPVATALAEAFEGVIGFDRDPRRIAELRDGHDRTRELSGARLKASRLALTDDAADLAAASFVIVAVPTPIDADRRPDLSPLRSACEMIGRVMRPGTAVVFESTVYPGVTEEFCGPLLERASGLARGRDFTLGYSPERINPGDSEHTLEKIVKVVSAEDAPTLERLVSVYGRIIAAGLHEAPSIRVAEAAKVIENTQRDLNIALMNELALIFDRLGIRTADVLAAARTKWNFLPFTPGLVGGHCIGVDPYYLTSKAEAAGYHPQVILAGRRINDGMGVFIAQRVVKLLIEQDLPVKGGRVGVVGLTFKENVPDLRNSRVPDILGELRSFGLDVLVHDPHADADEAGSHYGVRLLPRDALRDLDALILAVPHREILAAPGEQLFAGIRRGGIFADVKSAVAPERVPEGLTYWSL